MKSVQFKNVSSTNVVYPFSKSFNKTRREDQQMLQELTSYRHNVEANRDPNNVRRITRKRNVSWSPAVAKRKANELAAEMNYNTTAQPVHELVALEKHKKLVRKSKVKQSRKAKKYTYKKQSRKAKK